MEALAGCFSFSIFLSPYMYHLQLCLLKTSPPSKSLLQVLVSFLVTGEHSNQQEIHQSMEKIKLQLELEERTVEAIKSLPFNESGSPFLMAC